MQRLDDGLVLSPSDLTGFAACRHLTQLELGAARGEHARPSRDDPMLDVLARRGGEHEVALVDAMRREGKSVVEIPMAEASRAELREAQRLTLDAMRSGMDVIYQATFFDERWRGHADFLLRVDRPSDLGDFSYEVADAKLAHRVRAGALVQMGVYSELLAGLQGTDPEWMHVLAGDGARHSFRVREYAAYTRRLRERFEAVADAPPVATQPDPVTHCAVCRWLEVCDDRRRAMDHLCLVAGVGGEQARKLTAAGVHTRQALAASSPALTVPGMGTAALTRLRAQAEIQVRGEGQRPPLHELLAPEPPNEDGEWPRRGWAALSAPSPGDVFFDMEGDPYVADGGLEYLFGVVTLEHGEPAYRAFWAHDRHGERLAFEAFVDFVIERLDADPAMHVYHYANYEPAAVKRLMGAFASRETQVDRLLRAEVFVDLYSVVRHAIRCSTESYSLKEIETLYMERPDGAVMDAGASIVAYEQYLESRDPAVLKALETYNTDDCASLVGLRDWLEDRRQEVDAEHGPVPRPSADDGAASEELAEHEAEMADLAGRLTADVPDVPSERDPEQQARWLLAQLLGWHRREDKPDWWAFFHRLDLDLDDLTADPECIGGLTFVGEVGTEKRSIVYRYAFEPQDHKFGVGATPVDPATGGGAGTVMAIDDGLGHIDLKRGPKLQGLPHPLALIPGGPLDTSAQREAIAAIGEWVAANGIDAPGPHRAARDLLLRRPPRTSAGLAPSEPLVRDSETLLDAARRLALDLDHTTLAIQGPPGSGKTFTAAHMILALLAAGRRVGITSNSHSAIANLLDTVCDHRTPDVEIRGIQKADDDQRCETALIEHTSDNATVEAKLAAGAVNLVAGTSWLWSRPGMRDSVDVLVVDEAGQISLANVLAASPAAASLVLVGDPQQLAQPSTASHPTGAEASALEHLLGERPTIPAHLGLFLHTTYRMHPQVCRFVSEIAYEQRLHSEDGLERQNVGGLTGLVFSAVEHEGNRTSSEEEAADVATITSQLVGCPWTDQHGTVRLLTLDDILIVAPYNAHVACLRRHLGDGARIGTVDKFQGREAPVAIYSMATSSPEEVPRTMEFLYDLHRLNVAVSRAQALAILVCSPALLEVLCRNPEQMRLANALCRYAELAEAAAAPTVSTGK